MKMSTIGIILLSIATLIVVDIRDVHSTWCH